MAGRSRQGAVGGRARPVPAAGPTAARGGGRAPAGAVALRFPGLPGPVLLDRAPKVEAGLRATLKGWTPARQPLSAPPSPRQRAGAASCVLREADGYALESPHLETPMQGLGVASAVCGVIADLAQGFYGAAPGCLALHAGSFLIGGRLVAVAGPPRAGKSTLIARLTAEPDVSVLGDDVLPILGDGLAFGLGAAPRLRLPLPADASAAFRAHVAATTVLRDTRYAYLRPPTLAPHGTRAALRVILVLDRQAGGPASLHRLPPEAALNHVLLRTMENGVAGQAAMDRLGALAEAALCLTLRYHDLDEAVALIRSAFGTRALPGDGVAIGAPVAVAPTAGIAVPALAGADPARVFARSGAVALRRLPPDAADGAPARSAGPAAAVLWHLETGGIVHLNPLAAAVWALLEWPASADEIAADLAAVFPQEQPGRIALDVAALLDAFAAADLIAPA